MSEEKNARIAAAQKRMAELGELFVRRTRGEVAQLRRELAQCAGGDKQALDHLQHLAHKIRGTGATLGFEAVSDRAAELETLAARHASDDISDDVLARMQSAIDGLTREVERLPISDAAR